MSAEQITEQEGGEIRCSFMTSSEASLALQKTIEQQLRSKNFPAADIFGIRTALEEALTNAMKHGNQWNKNKKVTVLYSVTDECFEAHISDEGEGFDPEDVADPLQVENLERSSGRGLLIIRSCMTEVTYHPPGNKMKMRKVRTHDKE